MRTTIRTLTASILFTNPILATAQGIDPFKPELETYIRCQRTQAARISSQPGDPMSLAKAATSMCPGEENKLIDAIRRVKSAQATYNFVMFIRSQQVEPNAAAIVRKRASIQK
jgi:hypothetical protein